MYFQDITSLLHMDGHGMYVWSTYAIGLLVVTYNVLVPVLRRKRVIGQIKRQIFTEKQARAEKTVAIEP